MNTVEDRLRAALAAKSDAVSLHDYQVELPEPCALLVLPDPHHHARQRWHAVLAAAVAAVILVAVGVTVLAGRDTHHLATAGRANVPWSQVGPDWTLAVAAPEHDLVLVSPAGVRYLICPLPAPFVQLQPWTFSTGKALLTDQGYNGPLGTEYGGDVLIVDLHTGAQIRTSVSPHFNTIQFAGPGLDSLLVTYPSSMQLASTGTGHTLARYPLEGYVFGSAPSPDGSQVVAGGLAGLVVFDRASGRRTRTLTTPVGYGHCQFLRWLPGGDDVLAECFTRTQNVQNQDFTFAANGSRAPQPDSVPVGWQQIRLATGNVAFQPAAHNIPGPLDVVFSRVALTGRLTHLSVPAELEQGRWYLAAATANLLVFDERTGQLADDYPLQTAAWNPLTGTFTILPSGATARPWAFSHTSWQQYPPPQS
jgi:hypothetical protein